LLKLVHTSRSTEICAGHGHGHGGERTPSSTSHDDSELELSAVPFRPNGPADIELDWFFNLAECDMGTGSNYAILLGPQDGDSPEDRAEACHAQRIIRRRLLNLGGCDAGVLQVAYAARPWSSELRKALGRATGVVVRLAAAEMGLPDDDKELDVLELRTAGWLAEALTRTGPGAVERLRPQALALLKRAFRAYVQERGGKEKPALRGAG
jgi:hypothetical protein